MSSHAPPNLHRSQLRKSRFLMVSNEFECISTSTAKKNRTDHIYNGRRLGHRVQDGEKERKKKQLGPLSLYRCLQSDVVTRLQGRHADSQVVIQWPNSHPLWRAYGRSSEPVNHLASGIWDTRNSKSSDEKEMKSSSGWTKTEISIKSHHILPDVDRDKAEGIPDYGWQVVDFEREKHKKEGEKNWDRRMEGWKEKIEVWER